MTSIVLGDDMISRLNFRSLCGLRQEILEAISRAKVPKVQILRSIVMSAGIQVDELMYPRGEEPNSSFKQAVHQFEVIFMRYMY
jgi:hypothetical protein